MTDPSKVLVIVGSYDGLLLVSPESISAASDAQRAADEVSEFENFGDVRRSGNLDYLIERLDRYGGADLETYLHAIEVAAGVHPTSSEISERLVAVSDFVFDGEEDLPGDGDDHLTSWEREEEVEDVYGQELLRAMVDDVPTEILREFDLTWSPIFGANVYATVPPEKLASVVERLRSLGYEIRDE